MSKKTLSNVQNGIIYRSTLPVDIRDDQSKNYHILAPTSHLILSSAAGSNVVVSGSLNIVSGAGTGSFSGRFSGSLSGSADIFGGKLSNINASGTFSGTFSGGLDTNNTFVNNSLGHLILSSSVGSIIRASGALGALDTTTAALPAAAVIFSGAIVWDSTRKALKVYGPEGWTVIATGTVG